MAKRLTANVISNFYALGTTTVIQLGSVPLFLFFWSKEQYGEWILLSSIPSYLSLGEAGFGTLAANKVAMAVAQGDTEKATRALHTAWGFIVFISIVLWCLLIPASFGLNWTHLFHLTILSDSDASLAVFFLGSYTLVGLSQSIFGAVYRAAYKFPRYSYITNSTRLVELVATAFLVLFSRSFIVVSVGLLITRIILTSWIYFDSIRVSPTLRLGIVGFSRAELKETWRPSLLFMAFSIGNAAYFQGLTVLVGIVLNPAAVVAFNTTRTLTRVIVQFVSVIKQSIWPEFSYLYGANEMKKARRLNELAFELTALSALGLSFVIYTLAPVIMQTWTHHLVLFDSGLLTLLLISAVLNALWFVTSGVLLGINKHEQLALWYVAVTVVSLGLGKILIPIFGVRGAAGAMIICEAILLPYALKSSCKALGQSVPKLLWDSLQLKATRELVKTRSLRTQ